MRDPAGAVSITENYVYRTFESDSEPAQFLKSRTATALIRHKMLIEFEFADTHIARSKKLDFVTYPFEWTDDQLYKSAKLTLDLSKDIREENFELKDASPWNIIYSGLNPIFCDLNSFQRIRDRNWWAFGQFIRTFIYPLLISKYRGIRSQKIYSIFRDGPSVSETRKMVGLRRFLTRHWPVMLELDNNTRSRVKGIEFVGTKSSRHTNLYNYLDFLVESLRPASEKSNWSNYEHQRTHYTEEAINKKREIVSNWIDKLRPDWVIDLGCNAGEFSFICARSGANVICIDKDHDAIQSLIKNANSNQHRIFPALADIADMSGGRGWLGNEYASLTNRLMNKSDLTLMLALIHHIAILESIPFNQISEMASNITKKFLIVELIDETDPMIRSLCLQRNRIPSEFTKEKQLASFAKFFKIIDAIHIPTSHRTLVLYEKK